MTDHDLTETVDVYVTNNPEGTCETFADWPDAMTYFDTLVSELIEDGWTGVDRGWASASNTRCMKLTRGYAETFVTSEVNQ